MFENSLGRNLHLRRGPTGARRYLPLVLAGCLFAQVGSFQPSASLASAADNVSLGISASVCDVLVGCNGGYPTETALDPNAIPTQIHFQLFNGGNQIVLQGYVPVTYGGALRRFDGSIALPTDSAPGPHYLKLKFDNTLRRQSLIVDIDPTGARTNTVANVLLVPGDANNDNKINVVDYTIITADCYSDLLPAKDCADPVKRRLADIDYDGRVNMYDYNLYLLTLSRQGGD